MAVDAGIYGLAQPPRQQANPLASLAQVYQIQGFQDEAAQRRMAMDQQNKLLSLAQSPTFSSATPVEQSRQLQGIGAFDQAGKVITSAAAANKDQRAAGVSEFDLKLKQLEAAANIAGTVRDQSSYDRALPMMQQLGFDTSKFSPQYNPQGVAQFAQATLSAKDRLTNEAQMRSQDITRQNNIDTNVTSRLNNADTISNSARTADMADARSRDANAAGRVPTGYRQAGNGTLEFIPGGPADPASAKKASPTEFQGKSATYGSRAQEADKILNELEGSYSPAGINFKQAVGGIPVLGGISEASANASLSSKSQQAEQAQRDFVNAVLRQESGAAISSGEFDNAKKQYFPQPGDSAAVKQQKAANRQLVVQGFLNNAGNAPVARPPSAESTGRPGSGGGMAAPRSKADFDALPSGTLFTAPDGTTRRKP